MENKARVIIEIYKTISARDMNIEHANTGLKPCAMIAVYANREQTVPLLNLVHARWIASAAIVA
jgi:hypothetical protein